MIRWLVERAVHLLIVVLGVYTAVFFLLRLSGDPALLYVSEDAGPAEIQRVRTELGLADPVPVQYVRFLGRAVGGDFGLSLRHNQPALPLVLAAVPPTLELTFAALVAAAVVGVPAGVVSAARRNSLGDRLCSLAALVGQCVPTFWLGIILILILAIDLKLLPPSGRGTPAHLLMPALTLGAFSIARVARLTRSSMLEVLNQ
ncbi:MAG TPA: ABC transporter permease, partial [Gemmatimonadales bacterium]|nr:ABC transporter permease [Gemmatimonadales bacterium]